jgi:hypothetical protein
MIYFGFLRVVTHLAGQTALLFLVVWRHATGEWLAWWNHPWTQEHAIHFILSSSLSCFTIVLGRRIFDYLVDACGNPDVHLPGGPGSL